ncbi:unnamed protein product, partial [Urochloa humidicola]
ARCHAGEEGHGEEGPDSRARNRSALASSIPPAAARALPAAREIRRTRVSSAGCSASSVPGGSSAGRARGVRQWRAPARRRRLLPLLHSAMSASAELEGAATARSASGLPRVHRPLTGTAARPMVPAVLRVAVCSTARPSPLELLLEEETDHACLQIGMTDEDDGGHELLWPLDKNRRDGDLKVGRRLKWRTGN